MLCMDVDVQHVHLLIRTSNRPLGDLMRKVLTGYAISFNRRHGRHGYLYQNRYKSILCQEDEYLLELVRYIHLNPVRTGVVKSLSELDRYRWSGHGVPQITSLRSKALPEDAGTFGYRLPPPVISPEKLHPAWQTGLPG